MPDKMTEHTTDALPLPKMRYVLARVLQEARGLAKDFWKDGVPLPKSETVVSQEVQFNPRRGPAQSPVQSRPADLQSDGIWRAKPGEVSERMWGTLCVTPGDEEITERLIVPLGITKDMSLLDLSAGLGGRLLKTTEDFGVYISGMEPDPDIAARGMELAKAAGFSKKVIITHYDPMTLKTARSYDCVIARETIYRVPDKEKFVKLIADCCKKKSQISFTDYIVDPEVHDHPAIVSWREHEKGADPLSLVEMAELWAKQGFKLRVHDDQTDYYKKEVMAGMARLAKFLASGVKPDADTKKTIAKRLTNWVHRIEALNAGMKFYRFYGLR